MNYDTENINNPQELGAYIKSKRKQYSITLEQIQKQTKIRIKYLKAIEDGNFLEIPGGSVYRRGFLKNYVEVIGLDSDKILDIYKKIWNEPKDEENIEIPRAQDRIKLSNYLAYLTLPRVRRIGILFLAAIFMVLFMVLIRSLVMRISQEEAIPPIKQDPPIEEVASPIEESLPEPVEEEEVMVEIIEDTNNRTIYIIDDEIVEVTLIFSDRCWILVNKDGIFEFEGNLVSGEKKTWEAETSLNIRIGNPAVVDLTINGKNIGTLSGLARDFIFEKRTF